VLFRSMLSCLVDADHTDTDRFYSKQYGIYTFGTLQPNVRLDLLNKHIAALIPNPNEVSPERLKSRQDLYNVCLTCEIPKDISFFPLDGSVGLGKTFSGAVFALRVAIQRQADRFYNIIPYTNIISQTVGEYRKSMLLEGEDENNINEIHSKCEFDKIWMRKYSNRWNAPINVSTAVQFFESLVNNRTARLRKLHWFANSVFFFDEFDKSMPHEYWQYVLPLLKQMSSDYNCSFIFSSGTSAYYWDIFDECEIQVHDIIDKNTYKDFQRLEEKRIKIEILKDPITDPDELISHIWEKLQTVGSGLIVCNTINNACVLADMMRRNNHGYEIQELTGWQTPTHRERILDNVKEKLREKKKILVVATSTIECGVDISFDVGWREKCGALNLFQFSGRINRGSKNRDAMVYVFSFDKSIVGVGKLFTANPQNLSGIQVFDATDQANLVPSYCSEIVRQELNGNRSNLAKRFITMEENRQLQSISDDFSVIDSATAIIIIDKDLIRRIKAGDKVRYNEIVRNSIQLWFTKIEKIQDLVNLNVITSVDDREYFAWEDEYDEQTGIGRRMLDLRAGR
jgi:CRISPR-associated endonuclease/helicase Cas3